MTFDEFLDHYQGVPLIESSTFALVCDHPAQLRVQVDGWRKKGYLHPLKRGVYILDERFRKVEVSPLFLANYLLAPSYVSLEYALSHYGLIPERAYAYTSVSTRGPRRYENVLGTFTYRHVKADLFFGYEAQTVGGHEVLIAAPEKALLDYFHLNSGALEVSPEQVESLRLQNLERLDLDRIEQFARPFNAKVRGLAALVAEALAV